ncbi:diaminopimelate decarboxylase [Buchnera aphidicola]|uniref:diaminopimelate decarboxylase n=1 Tax=Buchnera aphidicola TaxID=9 RepID=UPI00094CA407|nr:diaminopimelate decarboxylase [Buchnera aphidicola]
MSKIKKIKRDMLQQKNIIYLTQKYNTPLWLYNAQIIKNQIKKLKQFDVIRFAQKSCSNINILKFIKSCGVTVDAVSLGEIQRAILAGFTAKNNDLVYTSDILERNTLKKIIQYNIPVNIGSLDMVKILGKASPGHHVWLRINPKFGDGHHIKTNTGGENSKHGIWDIEQAISEIKRYHLLLIGIHMHIGSGINESNIEKMCNTMIHSTLKIKQNIQFISAGGGLNIPYHKKEREVNIKKYFNIWNTTRNIIASKLSCPIKLEIEPGRFLVAQSGVLIAQVCSVKKVGNNHFIILDAGFNDLMRPMLYGSYHKISVIYKDSRPMFLEKTMEYIISGPLCESGDVFTIKKNGSLLKRKLPIIFPEDYIVIHDTGAYGASMSSNYNSRPLIPEILYKNNNFYEIRKRQSMKELLKLEILN